MNPSTTGDQIPVVVLAGFLGSGKTTLLNHLLRRRAGNRIAVVVNDFGAVEIDAMTVAGQVGSTVSLGNGCLCCAVDASELDGYLERLSRPAARIDLIVIEASGLAEPQELVRMILTGDNPRTVYGGLVQVVDAAEFDATRDRHPETDRHLAIADLVVLNKTDRVTAAEHERVLGVIGTLGPGAAVVSASYGRIDPGLLFDPAARPAEDEKIRQLSFEDLRADEGEDRTGRTRGSTRTTRTPGTRACRTTNLPPWTRAGSWPSSTRGPKGSTASRASWTSGRPTPATATPYTPSAASCACTPSPGHAAPSAAPSSSSSAPASTPTPWRRN